MTKEDIIRMAVTCQLITTANRDGLYMEALERFAALVAAAEREKSLQLWMLLDDVDTADDIAKTDEAIYRSLCRQAHAKRWSLLNGNEVDAAIQARGQA